MRIEQHVNPTHEASVGQPCVSGLLKGDKVGPVKRRRPFRSSAVALMVSLGLLAAAGVVTPAGAASLSEKKAEASAVADKLAALDSQAMELGAQYEAASYELTQIQDKLDAAKVLSQQTAAEADKRRDDLRRYAVAAYQSGNDSLEFEALITNNAETGVQKRSYLQTISGSRQDLVDALNSAKQKADEDAERQKKLEGDAASRASEMEQMKAAADSSANEQRSVNAKVQGELKSLVDAENSRRASEAAAARAAAVSRSSSGSGSGSVRGSGGGSAPNPNAPSPDPRLAGAIAAGMKLLGTPYIYGAAGPNAFDCSGFIMTAYREVGISIGRASGNMYGQTVRISESQLVPGDLVFYGPGGSEHVGIYIGGDQLLHTFGSTRSGVTITAMTGWWKPPTAFGRIP